MRGIWVDFGDNWTSLAMAKTRVSVMSVKCPFLHVLISVCVCVVVRWYRLSIILARKLVCDHFSGEYSIYIDMVMLM